MSQPVSGANTATGASPAPRTVIGDCSIRLSHQTTYEPPLYLFPELLEQVPQGSPPVAAWDAVADAIDVSASFWRFADPSTLTAGTSPGDDDGGEAQSAAAKSSGDARPPYGSVVEGRPLYTLAAMVAANRLLPAGFTADTLKAGNFSAAAMIEELTKLQRRLGVGPQLQDGSSSPSSAGSDGGDRVAEGALLMSNHFVNMLAWKKLKEINESPARHSNGGSGKSSTMRRDSAMQTTQSGTGEEQSTASNGTASPSSRKRRRQDGSATSGAEEDDDNDAVSSSSSSSGAEASADDILEHMKASPDPWSTEIDERRFAGRFVSGKDRNFERRVALLDTLSRLYSQPPKRLCSQGVQTDFVVPPCVMNATSPYADPHSERVRGAVGAATGKATLDAHADLHWGSTAAVAAGDGGGDASPSPAQRRREQWRKAAEAAGYAVMISSASREGKEPRATASQPPVPPLRVPLLQATTTFGRAAGPCRDARTGSVRTDVGLTAYTQRPEQLSALHFALMLKPIYETTTTAAAAGHGDDAAETDSSSHGTDSSAEEATQALHRKTPTGFSVFLVNYGRNGVRVRDCRDGRQSGSRWVLGDLVRVPVGCEILIGDDIVVRLEDETGASEGLKMEQETDAVGVASSSAPDASQQYDAEGSQVKRERVEE